ncbi:MAG: hypothetical protein LDL41_18835 [Coleofasciculus sp. S288]|nr:hypothetical protein [Coleofasciculus sp. S288]
MYRRKKANILPTLGISLVAVSFLIGMTGKSVKLTCNSPERRYVHCQQKRSNFYGLWTEPTQSFRLRGAEVEEYTDTDSDGNTQNAYRLYFNTGNGNERIDFHDYGRDFEKAFADRGRLLDLLIGVEESSLSLHRRNIGSDISTTVKTIFFASVAVSFLCRR